METVDLTAVVTSGTCSYIMLAEFSVSLLLAKSMNKLWDFLNGLQVVQFQRLFDTYTPGNVSSFQDFFGEITRMELFSIVNLIKWYTYVPEYSPYSLSF